MENQELANNIFIFNYKPCLQHQYAFTIIKLCNNFESYMMTKCLWGLNNLLLTHIYYMCVTYSEKAITYNKCACVAINCENRDTT